MPLADAQPKPNPVIEWMRSQVARIPESEVPEPRFFMDPRSFSILNMARAGANSALNWLDATNRALQGYDPRGALEQGDMLAPLGLSAMAAPFAVRGAIGSAGGRLAASASGLPMDEASRMARAREMGFDTDRVLYHQTAKENVPSLMEQGFDLSRAVARAGDSGVPDGVFLKGTDADISVGASGDKAAQIPLYARLGNTASFRDRTELERFLSKDPEYSRLVAEEKHYDFEKSREFDALEKQVFRPGLPEDEYQKGLDVLDNFLADWRAENIKRATAARARATQLLREAGYDSVSFEDAGSFGRKIDAIVVLDPKNLRSVNAAFDPSKSDSANLLAADMARSSLPGTVINADQDRRRIFLIPLGAPQF